ncbi:MAG TPA: hypothetical protein ENG03_07785 [Thioploca sp.]|nr:MAG: hypothetical protein DRR19_13025 [Gammaproteobacteria bacterium]HDN26980.1 hypothetical protein [Thioploca sp.]
MKRKSYAATLALVAGLALSEVANAKEIEVCRDVSIDVEDVVDAGWCYNAISGAVATCSAPVDGGGACAFSVLVAAQSCRTSVETLDTIIKECDLAAKLERELKEAQRKAEAALRAAAEKAAREAEAARIAAEDAARSAQRSAEYAARATQIAAEKAARDAAKKVRKLFGG